MNQPRALWVNLYFNTDPTNHNTMLYKADPMATQIGAVFETTKSINTLFQRLLHSKEDLNEVFHDLVMLNKKVMIEAKQAALKIRNEAAYNRFILVFINHVFEVTIQEMAKRYKNEDFVTVCHTLEYPPLNRLWGILEFIKNTMPVSVASYNGDFIDLDMIYLFNVLYSLLNNIKKVLKIDDGVPHATYDCIWDISNFSGGEIALLKEFKISKDMLKKHPS